MQYYSILYHIILYFMTATGGQEGELCDLGHRSASFRAFGHACPTGRGSCAESEAEIKAAPSEHNLPASRNIKKTPA